MIPYVTEIRPSVTSFSLTSHSLTPLSHSLFLFLSFLYYPSLFYITPLSLSPNSSLCLNFSFSLLPIPLPLFLHLSDSIFTYLHSLSSYLLFPFSLNPSLHFPLSLWLSLSLSLSLFQRAILHISPFFSVRDERARVRKKKKIFRRVQFVRMCQAQNRRCCPLFIQVSKKKKRFVNKYFVLVLAERKKSVNYRKISIRQLDWNFRKSITFLTLSKISNFHSEHSDLQVEKNSSGKNIVRTILVYRLRT